MAFRRSSGEIKKMIFRYIRDRLWNRLSSWRKKKIPRAGKEILIKSAAQAIPAFCMTSFSPPALSCKGASKDVKFILVQERGGAKKGC